MAVDLQYSCHMNPSRYIAVLVLALALLAPGCAPQPKGEPLAPPVRPVAEDFSSPQAGVRTYLDWTNLAYRMANSQLSTQVAGPNERVRVDAYIQLNRDKNQGIEQHLENLTVRSESVEGTRAVVALAEQWRYRYFTLDTQVYKGSWLQASYETTYTLEKESRGWVVQKVDAKPLSDIE